MLAPLRDLAPDLVAERELQLADGTVSQVDRSVTDGPIRVRDRRCRSGRRVVRRGARRGRVGGRAGPPAVIRTPRPGVDLVLLCVPDAAVGRWWRSLAGARRRRGRPLRRLARPGRAGRAPAGRSLHPLVSLPDPVTGRGAAAWRLVRRGRRPAGVRRWSTSLGGSAVEVPDDDRVAYHAAAVMASNHLVALMGQVERLAGSVGVPLEAFLAAAPGRARQRRGEPARPPRSPGPVARGDWDDGAAPPGRARPERARAYRAMAEQAARLVGRSGSPSAGPATAASEPVAVPRRADRVDDASRELRADAPSRPCRTALGADAPWAWCPDDGLPARRSPVARQRPLRADCDVVVMTIFVNPLQFAPDEDLATYPRDPEGDAAKAASAGCHGAVRARRRRDVPRGPRRGADRGGGAPGCPRSWRESPGGPTSVGCARSWPSCSTSSVPCRAYFGEKDFQQLAIVRRMAQDLSFPVEVVGCPIVREPDGLAMSSAQRLPDRRGAGGRARAAPGAAPGRRGDPQRDDRRRRGPHAHARRDPGRTARRARLRRGRRPRRRCSRWRSPTAAARLFGAVRFGRARLIDNVAVAEVGRHGRSGSPLTRPDDAHRRGRSTCWCSAPASPGCPRRCRPPAPTACAPA